MRTALILLIINTVFSLNAQQFGTGYADLVEKIQDGVVHIQTIGETRQNRGSSLEDFFGFRGPGQSRPERGSGSGFIISEDGFIVTNRHVIAESSKVSVDLVNGKSYEADVIGIDNSLDVALIKIDAKGLTAFNLGDSDKLRIGDVVLAMGYPLQLGFSVTAGIVSGIGRNMQTGSMDLGTYIQSDADITFGNSGGPLVNAKGEVIGINTMIVERGETFGFAIPSNLFKHSVDQLKRYGEVRRGALGIQLTSLDEVGKEYYGIDGGALITRVYDDFPAADAGLKADDVIIEIDGKKVGTSQDVISSVARKAPGEEVTVKILSGGKQKTKTFALGDRNNFRNPALASTNRRDRSDESGLGFSVAPLDSRVRRQAGLERDVEGILVTKVEPGSMAEEKGIQPGVVITSVNRKEVNDLKDLNDILDNVAANQPVPVRVLEPLGNGQTRQRTVFLRKQE